MFAGGSGVAPFRSFWQARAHMNCTARTILFLGVKYRNMFLYEEEIRYLVQKGKLEVHVAFSRDRRGVVYDHQTRTLVEKELKPRYLDSVILDAGEELVELMAPREEGGLGGYIYICGSAPFYETVSKALLNIAPFDNVGPKVFNKAFSQGRVMLDIFSPPRLINSSPPLISTSDLARHTGHGKGQNMWVAVHEKVYDVTNFLPIHPGGKQIISTSAGKDCSSIFDRIGHSSNGEVMSLLSNYLIGKLCPVPTFRSEGVQTLWNIWRSHLSSCVELITTTSLEISTLQNGEKWFDHTSSELDMNMVRKLYQFQSRFMDQIIEQYFGVRFLFPQFQI
jgi:predicted heme/steroid binding protein